MAQKGPGATRLQHDPKMISLFLGLSLLLIWFIAIAFSTSQREAGLRQAEDEIYRLTQIVAEQTGNLLLDVRVYLGIMDEWLKDHPQADPRTDPGFVRLVESLRHKTRVTVEVRVVSRSGGLFYVPSLETDSPLSQVEDREYFVAQESPENRGFYVGAPILGRLSGVWSIPVSYPLSRKNAGMELMLALIELPVLNELFEVVRPKPDGAITLVRSDGLILDQVPFDQELMGHSLKDRDAFRRRVEGVQTGPSWIDGSERIFATSKVRDIPVEVSVSVSKAGVLRVWSDRMHLWAAILSSVSFILVLFARSLRRSWRFIVSSEQASRELNEDLRNAQETSRLITEHSNDILTVIALPDFVIEFVSPSVERHRGWTPQEFMALPPERTLGPESLERVNTKLQAMLADIESDKPNARFGTMELDLLHRDGHPMPYELMITIVCDESGQAHKILTLARDLSERKANDELLRHMAFFDRLTNLPNRRLLEDRLYQFLSLADREHLRLAMLFIDLDEFKPVNDSLGHAVGDWLLQEVSRRMQACLRAHDTVARIGGDEFVVLLPEITSREMVRSVAEKIRNQVALPYKREDGSTLSISASIGIVLYPDHAHDLRELLLLSDKAMYQAKKAGRNQVVLYDHADDPDGSPAGQLVHLNWSDVYHIGEPRLDHSRREMFQKANVLLDHSMATHTGDSSILRALDDLLAHIVAHFEEEEALLGAMDYPALSQHQRMHEALLVQLEAMKRDYLSGTLFLGAFIEFFASRLIADHFLKADQDYRDLFASFSED